MSDGVGMGPGRAERPPDEAFTRRVTRRIDATERRRIAFLWLAGVTAASLIAIMALGVVMLDTILTGVLHRDVSAGLRTLIGALCVFAPLTALLALAVFVWPRR